MVEPNPGYWGTRPALKSITFYVIDNDEATIAKFRNGLVDVTEVPVSATDAVRNDAKLSPQLVKTPLLEVFWLDFNTQKPPFNNPKVRQAFAMAIDRGAYASDALKGRAVPASAPIPKPLRGAQTDLSGPQAFDAAKAKAILDASGAPPDQLANIRLVVRNTPTDRRLADFIAAQIKQNLGLNLVIDATDIRAIGRKIDTGDFHISGPTGWTADYPDEQDILDLWRRTDGNNHARYDNQRYDDLIRQADAQRDQAKRDQLYLQAQRMLVQDAPSAFLDQTVGWWLVRPQVRGAFATPLDDWPGDLFTQRIYIAA
jgi:oligopeptide transport system substrate-binding protein